MDGWMGKGSCRQRKMRERRRGRKEARHDMTQLLQTFDFSFEYFFVFSRNSNNATFAS